MSQANPLLQDYDLPPYSSIRPEHVVPAIEQVLAENRAAIATILQDRAASADWNGLVRALDELNARLGRAWGPVSRQLCPSARATITARRPEIRKRTDSAASGGAWATITRAVANIKAGNEVAQ